MTTYTRYAARTGRILGNIEIPDWDEEGFDLHNSLLLAGDWNPDTHYVITGKVAERPPMNASVDKLDVAADGEDRVTIISVPPGAMLSVSGPIDLPYQSGGDDNQIALTFDLPGDYTIRITCFPYLDWEAVIHAG